jgi:hypothetical protein
MMPRQIQQYKIHFYDASVRADFLASTLDLADAFAAASASAFA